MIKPVVAWLGVTLLTGGLCTKGGEFEPPLCPTGLPLVASVRIEQQGVAVWTAPGGPSCRRFRLS